MPDIYTKIKRSEIMSKVSGKETKPEILIRKYLFANNFWYRKNDKRYPGKPDILLPKYKTAVFINGCFWHGHDCTRGKLPETNIQFWTDKISSNIERDKRNISELKKIGWNVIVVWQCSLTSSKCRTETLEKLKNNIISGVLH